MPSYYEALGVPKGASQKEVRQAFRRLARQYHPDLHPGDKAAEAKFKEINEANEVLSDPDKRKKYDQYGDKWKYADQIEAQRRQGGGAPFERETPFGGRGRANQTSDYGDLFGGLDDLLGGAGVRFGRRGGAATAARIESQVAVSLEEAFAGARLNVTIPATIPAMRGGAERRIEVTVPPGVDTGSVVHVSLDKGSELYLNITVSPHPRFRREGSDLYTEVEVPFEDAVLGGEADVQTLKGRLRLKVPPESQNGQKIRLSGQGMPKLGSPQTKGDLYAVLRPVLPKNLTPRELELLKSFKDLREARR